MIIVEHKIEKEIKNSPRIHKHAKDRALERYGMNAETFGNFVCKNFRKFKFVSITYGYTEEPSRMFIFDNKTFVFALLDNLLITTYPCDTKKETESSRRYRQRLIKRKTFTIDDEVRKIERKETKELRNLTLYRAELESEISERRKEYAKSRSASKKIALAARIEALKMRIEELPAEMVSIKVEKIRKLQALTEVYGHIEKDSEKVALYI